MLWSKSLVHAGEGHARRILERHAAILQLLKAQQSRAGPLPARRSAAHSRSTQGKGSSTASLIPTLAGEQAMRRLTAKWLEPKP